LLVNLVSASSSPLSLSNTGTLRQVPHDKYLTTSTSRQVPYDKYLYQQSSFLILESSCVIHTMKISHLLNPFCGGPDDFRSSKSPTPACYPVTTVDVPRRQKIPKDAPIFSEGNRTVGNVNFPPHEAGDDQELLQQHRRFQIYPLGEIFRKGVRHIPYNSDKKAFHEKTGREAFESEPYLML
jgi:hypothetical protein